ncbi:MAG: DNA mismatch repair endonuclease MutL [Alphaproteobacteria bacterium]|nr:DNA mismatch repair endonuclease MutL [Alphaproteobacteria bacterium]
MSVRVLPDFLINQIAAGEVVEKPSSVVKELVENALDAGADQIVIDVVDGGRTMISVIDNGKGMNKEDLANCVLRHATSKLPTDDLLNINFMGFRGEALPSIASVSNMVIDTNNGKDSNGWCFEVDNNEIKPSDWESGTRIRVSNLFGKTPARLKFLHTDKAEMLSVLDTVKRLAVARPDVGFVLNNKWFFPKNQNLIERVISVMGEDVRGQMLEINSVSSSSDMHIHGFISKPTLRRASSIDQYLFVNNRPVKDKILVAALRASYMDVMHAREFPLCALYLDMPSRNVDVNVSPAKTEVHFLEPTHVRAFIIKTLREALSKTLNQNIVNNNFEKTPNAFEMPMVQTFFNTNTTNQNNYAKSFVASPKVSVENIHIPTNSENITTTQTITTESDFDMPLGHVIGQLNNKYILAENKDGFVIIDQHAAHERITYEKLRTHAIKTQPLLTPLVIKLKSEDVDSVLSIQDELKQSGLHVDAFGENALAIFEKPADWDLNWEVCFHEIADEVRAYGHSSRLNEKLHLKLANYACHHSVRAGRKLNMDEMDALLRDIERTERGGECNHGRPVYKVIPISELDAMFERI